MKRQKKKELHLHNSIDLPKVGEEIQFKEEVDGIWQRAKVVRTFKKTSKFKNYRHLKLENGDIIEKDFVNEVKEWGPVKEEEEENENYYMHEILENNSFPVKTIPREDWCKPEVKEARPV